MKPPPRSRIKILAVLQKGPWENTFLKSLLLPEKKGSKHNALKEKQ